MGRVGSLEVADYANTTSTLVDRVVAIGGVGGTGTTARYILPSLALNLDFTTGTLDPRITFTRATTGSYYNSAGVLSTAAINAPRFDYNPVTLQPKGLLIEESRTNLLTYSEQFDNAAWSKNAATITANSSVAPDGTLTADKIYENSTSSQHLIFQTVATTSGQSYAYSIFAKMTSPAEWTSFSLQLGSGGGIGIFNLSTVSASVSGANAVSASMQSVGNGWYRCTLLATSNGSSTNYIYRQQASYVGDGTSGIYLWGAQLEAGSFATSYIPTVASQVTCAADVAVMTGTNFSSWYNQSEGTVYAETLFNRAIESGAFPTHFSINDGTNTNRMVMFSYQSGGNKANFTGNVSGSFSWNMDGGSTVVSSLNANKLAGAYKLNDIAFSVNSGSVLTDNSAVLPIVNTLQLGKGPSGDWLNGHIKRITYYNKRLANSVLQYLTR